MKFRVPIFALFLIIISVFFNKLADIYLSYKLILGLLSGFFLISGSIVTLRSIREWFSTK
jgi:hypothetical protein